VNPPLQISPFSVFIVGGGGRVYEIIHFHHKWLVNPPLPISPFSVLIGEIASQKISQNPVGAGSKTIYETHQKSHKPAPSPPGFTSTFNQ